MTDRPNTNYINTLTEAVFIQLEKGSKWIKKQNPTTNRTLEKHLKQKRKYNFKNLKYGYGTSK